MGDNKTTWQDPLNGDALAWLLEEDEPGVRYLAMRDLLDFPADDPDLLAAQKIAHQKGPIATVLEAMNEEGYWFKPGPGYSPKYRSTVWSMILLSQLGATISLDNRIEKACEYVMTHTLTEHGQFSTSGAPSGNVDCLHGNLCAALQMLGYRHPRLDQAFEWMARSTTGEGIAPAEDKDAQLRYYAANSGPNFVCGYNGDNPCAWGAIKIILAFSHLPPEERTPLMEKAIQQGVDLLLGTDPAKAKYPTKDGKPPSGNWRKFGFPVNYVTDLLQNVEALVRLGYGDDPRLSNALDYIRRKQDENGRWALEYAYNTWVDFGEKKQPNKWVTYRAAWVLKNS